jgi:hypothetical protein
MSDDNGQPVQAVNVPAGVLYPEHAHLWTKGETVTVYLQGARGWVEVVPGHRTELDARAVDLARKQILKDDYMDSNEGPAAVADGWL